ncbi:MAG: CRISPR-associated endonuclease Cas2 [bacterium]|nr:CRISPR-associated endonuclease Cas2 [bacterium]
MRAGQNKEMKNMNAKKAMRGESLLKALEILEDVTYVVGDFVTAFLSSTKSNYLPLRSFRPRYHKNSSREFLYNMKERQKVYNLIHRLSKQGLIRKTEDKITISDSGKYKISELASSLNRRVPIKKYSITKTKTLVIIAFDIPEREKSKREWLRSVLINAGFSMLQKSVWIGKIKLSYEFIEDIQKLHLLDYVEILSVTKSGTIKPMI